MNKLYFYPQKFKALVIVLFLTTTFLVLLNSILLVRVEASGTTGRLNRCNATPDCPAGQICVTRDSGKYCAEGKRQGIDACYSHDNTLDENGVACLECYNKGGIWVAIGCVDPTPLGVITGLIRIAFGVMGGVALIQLIQAGMAYQKGDQGGMEKAKGKVIATLSGIALLVFSVLILRIIGVNVLDVIPEASI